MKISAENSRLTLLVSILIVTAAVAIPMIAFGVPLGQPAVWNLPTASFSSVAIGSPNAIGPAMTGSYGRYVGLSAPSTGSAGGYVGAKALCKAFIDSHVCTAREIINSIEYGITMPANTKAWINNGPPAYVSDISNDCNGWTSSNNGDHPPVYSTYGSIWNTTKNQSLMATCGRNLPFACCSY